MSSTDTPSRSNPSLFNASLFSSPSNPGNSGNLSSLGFGDDIFAGGSPFTLAPAAPLQESTKSSETDPTTSEDTGELSTVPLDSPSLAQMNNQLPPCTQPIVTPGSIHGWNDPPFLSSIMPQRSITQPTSSGQNSLSIKDSFPSLSDTSLDTSGGNDAFHIQPLVEQRRSESPRPTTGSLPPKGPPSGDTNQTNPYRLGGKKQATTYVPPPQPSQAPPTAPPTTNPYSLGQNLSSQVESTGLGIQPQPSAATVQPHWFYLRSNEQYWFPFSIIDSNKLEEAYLRSQADSSLNMIIQTDGGRYDVSVKQRQRCAVYWEEPIAIVRRCTWFYKGESDRWYMPYEEDVSKRLEEAYTSAVVHGNWNCRVDLDNGEAVIIHSPSAMVHYSAQHFQPLNHEVDYQPKSVLRGFLERGKVEMGEDRSVDHLVFVVHGIGPFSDVRINSFKALIDCVDDFREVAQLMLKTHKFGGQMITKGRVEFLPVHWHSGLHGDDTGVDNCIREISLPSISRLRDFTNSTLIDILFYTSPMYLQIIINEVASEMNRMMELFQQRNPGFTGTIALMGHSLGSCILFDLLSHQVKEVSSISVPPVVETDSSLTDQKEKIDDVVEEFPTLTDALAQLGLPQLAETFEKEMIDFDSLIMCSNDDLKDIDVPLGARKKLSPFISEWSHKKQLQLDKKVKEAEEKLAKEKQAQLEHEQLVNNEKEGIEGFKYIKGVSGTGQPFVTYPQLSFKPCCLFAIGSPIGLFITIRGVDTLGPDYSLPTCPAVVNIFHPFDPVAYRLEPLIISSPPSKPVLMPHHKGRKRFHLELYENIERMGQSVRYHLVEGIRNMWNQLNEFARAHTATKEEEAADVIQAEINSQGSVDESVSEQVHVPIGQLNGGSRVDYVLQEKPIEKINEYLFALSSHLCYWRSEDTALFVLRQMYNDSESIKTM